MLLRSGALACTPTHWCCCCWRLTLLPAASTVSQQGSCNSRLHYFIIWVRVARGLVSCATFTARTGTLPLCAGWRQLHRSWQMVFTPHSTALPQHEKSICLPVKSMTGVVTASVLCTWAVGGHKQHDCTVVTAVALYGPIFLFISFILYLSAHDGFGFASRLHRASYCFCRDLCTFLLASFMLPLAKSLLVHEPSRPLQHQPWQLKNKLLSHAHRVDLFLCPCLWLTFPNRHSPASGLQEVMRGWTLTQSRCSQCKCWFWPSSLIVFALHLIQGSPSLFSSCFVLESSLQISFSLGMVILTVIQISPKWSAIFLPYT